LAAGEAFCPQCGRQTAPAVPAIPGFEFQLESYASRLKALAVLWFVYSGLSLVMGIVGVAFMKAFMGGFGHWMNGPIPPDWIFPMATHLIVLWTIIRSGLAIAAGIGLLEHKPWGRIVALVAAFLSILKFPFGTALSIWTMVMLLGYRNSTLYDQL
jgi:hypothetical protein